MKNPFAQWSKFVLDLFYGGVPPPSSHLGSLHSPPRSHFPTHPPHPSHTLTTFGISPIFFPEGVVWSIFCRGGYYPIFPTSIRSPSPLVMSPLYCLQSFYKQIRRTEFILRRGEGTVMSIEGKSEMEYDSARSTIRYASDDRRNE